MLTDYEGLVDATNKDEDRISPLVRWCGIGVVIFLYILVGIIFVCAPIIAMFYLIWLFTAWLMDKIELLEKSLDWKFIR